MDHRKFFDIHAETWDERIIKDDVDKIDHILQMANIRKDENILDVGCGTGIILPFLKKMVGENGKVTALDISPRMLEKARAKFGDSFEYVRADIHSSPFEGGLFDKVICFNAFPHFREKAKALSEIFRVLKYEGSFVIAHSASREKINALHREVGSVVKNDRIPDKEKMHALFEKAGFTDTKVMDEKDFYFASGDKLK